jgi:hypothetical protein
LPEHARGSFDPNKEYSLSEVQAEDHEDTGIKPVGRVREVAFYAVAVFFALIILGLSPAAFAVLGWFLEDAITHRVHEISLGFIFVLSLVGLLAQLRRPTFKIAQMWQAAIPIWLTILAIILIGEQTGPDVLIYLILPILLIALHPGRPLMFRPPIDPSRTLVALTLVAAVPLLFFAITEFRTGQDAAAIAGGVIENLPDDISDEEAEQRVRDAADNPEDEEKALHFGHWSAMAAFAIAIAALAGLASLRPPGWRLPAWSAGIAAFVYGLASLVVPDDASAATAAWAVLAMLWGIGFIIAAEYKLRGPRHAESAPAPSAA